MPLPPAEKQRLYRDRKKKEAYFESDLVVFRIREASKGWVNRKDVEILLHDIYDVGGDRLVQMIGLLILEFAAVRNVAFSQFEASLKIYHEQLERFEAGKPHAGFDP